MTTVFASIDEVKRLLADEHYFADREIATTIFLAQRLEKPLFLEGEAGVGKTEGAKVLARMLNTRLIRLHATGELDATLALYEWIYPKQLLRIKMGESEGAGAEQLGHTI